MELHSSIHYIGWAAAGFCLIGLPLLLKSIALAIAHIERLIFEWQTRR